MNQRIRVLVGAACVWLAGGCFTSDVPVAKERGELGSDPGSAAASGGAASNHAVDAGREAAGGPAPNRDPGSAGDTASGSAGDTAPPVRGDDTWTAGGPAPDLDPGSAGDTAPTPVDAGVEAPNPEPGGAGYSGPQPVDAGTYANFGERLASIDADPCTIEQCHDTRCEAVTVSPGELETDKDEDGVFAGCGAELDCWDSDARVHPGQTEFFSEPFRHGGFADWDYDCNDQLDPQRTTRFKQCQLVTDATTCTGQGWILANSEPLPACGETARYAACKLKDGECVDEVVMLTQSCR